MTSGVAGYAIQTRSRSWWGRPQATRHYAEMDDLTGYNTVESSPYPSRAGHRSGVIELINPPPDEPFDRCTQHRVEALALALADHLNVASLALRPKRSAAAEIRPSRMAAAMSQGPSSGPGGAS